MTAGPQLKRRGFMGAGLLAAGGALGWLTGKTRNRGPAAPVPPTTLDNRFVYDISEFEKTDPTLLRYLPTGQFDTGFQRVKGLATAPGNGIWVAGDRSAKLFQSNGAVKMEILLDRPPHCLWPAEQDELLIGLGNFFEIYDSGGNRLLRSPRLGDNAFLTAITGHENLVYLADAGSREVLICDRRSGAVVDRFGKKDPKRNNPGFVVPSPYFDLAVSSDGRLFVANPGRLRMETYSLDGRFESSWGEAGMQIDRFCGCCNPVYFTLTPGGDFITSEKGLARINIYGADGALKGAVAGPDMLVEDKELARRACADCRIGAGFDVAVDDRGRVLALDPYHKVVRFFAPLAQA